MTVCSQCPIEIYLNSNLTTVIYQPSTRNIRLFQRVCELIFQFQCCANNNKIASSNNIGLHVLQSVKMKHKGPEPYIQYNSLSQT